MSGTSNIIEGNYKKLTGAIKEKWGKLTDDEIMRAQGNWDSLSGRIQEIYGYSVNKFKQEMSELHSRFETKSKDDLDEVKENVKNP